MNEIKVSTGYVPSEHAKQDAHSEAEKKKDVGGMLSAKLAKLFQ